MAAAALCCATALMVPMLVMPLPCSVYACGANHQGQLGMGDTMPRETFECINALKGKAVDFVSVVRCMGLPPLVYCYSPARLTSVLSLCFFDWTLLCSPGRGLRRGLHGGGGGVHVGWGRLGTSGPPQAEAAR